jgi:hypothetical protein
MDILRLEFWPPGTPLFGFKGKRMKGVYFYAQIIIPAKNVNRFCEGGKQMVTMDQPC